MKHPDLDELVRASRTDAGRTRYASHIASCAECADTIAWAMDLRAAAAAATRVTAPEIAWERIESRLDDGERLILPGAGSAAPPRFRAAAIAAGLILVATVGAALVPQTGVRAWIEEHVLDVVPDTAAPDDTIEPVVNASPASAGLILDLADGEMHVDLTRATASLLLRLRLTDAAEVEMEATGVAADAQFVAAAGRLEIVGAHGGEVTLLVPRSARWATIDIDGVRAVELRGGILTVNARADTVGADVLLHVGDL